METFEDMVGIVKRWIDTADSQYQIEFKNTPRNELVKYHTSLGRDIRNEFKLWERHWNPYIVEGIDYSPDHPAQISMRVIEGVWDELHKD